MPMIAAADPASKVTQTFPTAEGLGKAILDLGFIPIRPDGSVFVTQKFEGGLILDGAPLNVYYRNGWYPTQRELLEPHWGKDVPRPPENVVNLPLITDEGAREAIESYQWWKENEEGRIAGIPTTWLLLGGAGFLAYWFFLKE